MDNNERIAVGAIAVIFLAFAYLIRKYVSYFFCPLEKYTGQINNGKSIYILIPHLISSFGLNVVIFLFLLDFDVIEDYFDNDLVRIGSFLILWFTLTFLIGLLIELYLMKTDFEYRTWKQRRFKKD